MTLLRPILFSIAFIAFTGSVIANTALPLTKESAAEHIQQQSGGKVLSVDPKQDGDKQLFRVKVLHDDGKIKVYQLDAKTGREVQ